MGLLAKLGLRKKKGGQAVSTRMRRLSVSMEEDSILPHSAPGESFVISQAGIEFRKIKMNQDAYYVSEEKMIFAVFDGHGRTGHHCSNFVKSHLGPACESRTLTAEGLCEALVAVGDDMDADKTVDSQYSGTTVLAVLVTATSIVSAWLGDSRAVMGRWSEKAVDVVELSQDHKPEVPAERKRIQKAGGCVKQLRDEDGNKYGPLRVFKPSSTVPGVNFSRSMGDRVIHKYGVSSQVDCVSEERSTQDRFIVVASDGIFEFLTNLEVIAVVSSSPDVKSAAEELLKQARERWIATEDASDDITVIVIKLH